MNKEKGITGKQYFRILAIIHIALMIGVALFASIAYFMVSKGGFEPIDSDTSHALTLITPLLMLIGVLAGPFVRLYKINKLKLETDLKMKLAGYRAATIIRLALLEGPALFTVIAFLLTGDTNFLLYTSFMLLLFAMIRPTMERAIKELNLDEREVLKIQDPNEFVAELP